MKPIFKNTLESADSDIFERDLTELCGERARSSDYAAMELWCALANVQWCRGKGTNLVEFTFACAAGLVLEVSGHANVREYKTAGRHPGRVADWIRDALGQRGWRFVPVRVPPGGFVIDFSQPTTQKHLGKKR